MRGHNVCFCREIRKIIFELSAIAPLIRSPASCKMDLDLLDYLSDESRFVGLFRKGTPLTGNQMSVKGYMVWPVTSRKET